MPGLGLLAFYLNAAYRAVGADDKSLCIVVGAARDFIVNAAKDAGTVNLKTDVLRNFQFYSAEKRVYVQDASVLDVCSTQIQAYSTEDGINLCAVEVLVSEVVGVACKCDRDIHGLSFFHFGHLAQLHVGAMPVAA